MVTINNHISELRVSLPKDMQNIDDRTLLRLMNEFRSVYIKNTLNQRDTLIPEDFKQKIKGMELDVSEQKELNYLTDNSRILKSQNKVPTPVNLTHRDLVLRVWDSKVLGQNFNYVSAERAITAGNGKMSKRDAFVFLYDDYLCVKLKQENPNLALINLVSLEGIFEEPEKVEELNHTTYTDWHDYDYPITTTAWSYIKANILRDGLQVINSTVDE